MSKTLFVTGASSDIGNALIRRVACNYDTVMAHYRTPSELIESLCKEFGNKIIPVQADLSDLEQTCKLAKAVEDYEIEAFIHLSSSSAALNVRFLKADWEMFSEDIDISLRSAVLLSQACIGGMAKRKHGRIVYMLTSFLTSNPPPAFSPAYMTVKSGLYGLMRALSAEYAAKGVTVNGISPSMTDTKFLKDVSELAKELAAKNSPLKRNLTPDDIIGTFAWLLSEGAACVTGQNVAVTAGS